MSSIILAAFGFLFALLAVVFFLLSRECFFKAVMLVSETSSRHYHFLSRVLGFLCFLSTVAVFLDIIAVLWSPR